MKKWHGNIRFWLFILTIFSTCLAGAQMSGRFSFAKPLTIFYGIPFSFSLMFILGSHELGHYFAARWWGIKKVSLPMFIPLPFTPLGTLGALITIGENFKNRRSLFDIGAAGPLAGLAATFAVAWLTNGYFSPNEQFSIKIQIASAILVGILITLINLFPFGQLDGGHIFYALAGLNYERLKWPVIIMVSVYTIFFQQFIHPITVLFMFLVGGSSHPETLNDKIQLGQGRKLIGIAMIAALVIGLMALSVISGPGLLPDFHRPPTSNF